MWKKHCDSREKVKRLTESYKSIDLSEEILCLLYNITKAFDNLNHKILKTKLMELKRTL